MADHKEFLGVPVVKMRGASAKWKLVGERQPKGSQLERGSNRSC